MLNWSYLLSIALFLFEITIVTFLYLTLPQRRGNLACSDCDSKINIFDFLIHSKCQSCGNRFNFDGFWIMGILLISNLYLWFSSANLNLMIQRSFILAYFTLIFFIDLRTHYIFHSTTIFGMIGALILGFLNGHFLSSVVGALSGFALMFIFYLFGIAFTKFKNRNSNPGTELEEALGFGDVTLGTVIGGLVTFEFVFNALITGILLAGMISLFLIIKMLVQKQYSNLFIAYGPYLILGSIPYILF